MKDVNGLELASQAEAIWHWRRILQTHGNRLGESSNRISVHLNSYTVNLRHEEEGVSIRELNQFANPDLTMTTIVCVFCLSVQNVRKN
jgi:hypothetical protein